MAPSQAPPGAHAPSTLGHYRVPVGALDAVGSAPEVVSPCRLHLAVHPVGVTWTTIRRAHRGQYRGGSSSRLARHGRCAPSPAGRPQASQNSAVTLVAPSPSGLVGPLEWLKWDYYRVAFNALIGICSSASMSMSAPAGRPSVVR